MLWAKVFHIIFVVAWMAGLLYLPRLFVYHAQCKDELGHKRFLTMERKLYYGIMHPAAFLALGFGIWTVVLGWSAFGLGIWLYLKLALVLGLIVYHLCCGRWLKAFARGKQTHGHKFFRWMNEVPFVILLLITILVVVKPFGLYQPKCGVQILETVYSPDLARVATVFSSECFENKYPAVHISVLNAKQHFSDERGNIFIAEANLEKNAERPRFTNGAPKVEVVWSKEELLIVRYPADAHILYFVDSVDRTRIENLPFDTKLHR